MLNLKKVKGILGLSLIVAMSFGVVGCNSGAGDEKSEKKEIIVGVDDTFAPMGYKDENGELVGVDIDLAKEVGKRIDKEIKFQRIDWSMKETELNSGNIDAIWNGYTITDERKEKVAFSTPYLNNRQVIITLKDSEIKSKNDLKDKKVAAQNQSSAVTAMEKEDTLYKSFKDGKAILFETNNEAFMDLEAGRVDAVVADEVLARYYISLKGEQKFNVLTDDFGKEEYGIGFRKEDKELLESVNKALADMKNDGTSKTISEKWFAEDIIK